MHARPPFATRPGGAEPEMIFVHGQDFRELALALLAVSRQCGAIGVRLCFVGSEARLERARRVARDLDPHGLQDLCFRPLHRASGPVPEPEWRQAIDEVLAGIRPADGEPNHTVVWVDAPVPEGGDGSPLRALARAVESAPAPHPVLIAWELGDLDAASRGALLESCGTVASARMLAPDCPRWFLQAQGLEPGDDLGALAGSDPKKQATLGQLGAIIAHELGNPLSIISSSLQYLHERLVRSHDDASEFASAALANVERIQGLLRKMLEAGAPGKAVFERARLNEIVPELLRLTASECERRAVTVDVSFDPRIPAAWVDPQGLKQIVLNLMMNGLDALGGRGGRLSVRTRLSNLGDEMLLELENDGPPIQPDVLPHLFRPFHSTKVGGTGLGLYLSRQIARDHGGELDADNVMGGGVRFTLKLPVDRRREG